MLTTRSGCRSARPRSQSCLRRLAGRQVQVAEVQHPQRRAARRAAPARSTRRSVYGARLGQRRTPSARPRRAHRRRGGRAAYGGRRREGSPGQGCHNGGMSELKDRLRADLTTSIKARDEVRSSTLRMVLSAITNAEVAGKEARELSDDDIIGVLSTEAKKRREAATAFADGGRAEMAAKEIAEAAVIADYLPGPAQRAGDRRPRHRGRRPDRRRRRGHAGDGQGHGRRHAPGQGPRRRWRGRRRGTPPAGRSLTPPELSGPPLAAVCRRGRVTAVVPPPACLAACDG